MITRIRERLQASYLWQPLYRLRMSFDWLVRWMNAFALRPIYAYYIRRYLRTHPVSKLQLGTGGNLMDGWLNTDITPAYPYMIFMDVARRFPLPANSFDYVYSEHTIEHVPYRSGLAMLRECYRVLKPGGRIRIATPDLAFLISLYRGEKSDLQQRYILWASTLLPDRLDDYDEVFIINHFVRAWGHHGLPI